MFAISKDPLPASLLPTDLAAGGLVSFEGRVRNVNEGRPVHALEYEAFDALAVAEGERILAEARQRFPILEIACIHRVGLLRLGEVAIRVEAASGHRREAFEACEWVVDEVKRRVPIWKKEHYDDGPSDWINAQGGRVVTEDAFYSRQVRLPEVCAEGQRRLRESRILVVGAGGLGCPALLYLAAAGVGHLGVVDADTVDPTNLHRQPLYRHADVGRPKARLAAERVRSLNPFVDVEAVEWRLDAELARSLVPTYDLILDCTDNFATKFLLNDAAILFGKRLVLAGIHQYEGQLLTVEPEGPCLRCLWPQPPPSDCVGTCAEVGVLGFVPGVLGTLQAAEAVKLILGLPSLDRAMALVDLRDLGVRTMRFAKDPACPVCGSSPSIRDLGDDVPIFVESVEASDLLVDIREPDEVSANPVPGAVTVPMDSFDPVPFLEKTRIVLVCERGSRSERLARELYEAGHRQFFSLRGGRHALR